MMDPVETFTSAEVCELAGITYRQLEYWCRTRVIDPAFPADGSGSRRAFARDQVRVFVAVAALRGIGGEIDRTMAQRIARIEGPWEGQQMVLRRDGPVTWSIDLGWIEQMADEAIATRVTAQDHRTARGRDREEQVARVHSLMWAGRD